MNWLPESAGSVLACPDKAAVMGARRRAGARRTSCPNRNAVKFGPPGTPITVVVGAGPPVRLEVRDRGPGVPEEDRERIFQRFARTEKGGIIGVGLGLAIVRQVAHLYGGRVWVEGNPEGGSRFIAEFPPAGS